MTRDITRVIVTDFHAVICYRIDDPKRIKKRVRTRCDIIKFQIRNKKFTKFENLNK